MSGPSGIILTWDEEESNSRWYLHVGCDGGGFGLWVVPHDGSEAPTWPDAECAHCCIVFPLRAASVPLPEAAS